MDNDDCSLDLPEEEDWSYVTKSDSFKLHRLRTSKEKLSSKTFSAKLNSYYLVELASIKRELGVESAAVLQLMIDCYLLKDPESVKLMRKKLLKNIKSGVDAPYFIQVKLLYAAIGHVLKKAGCL